MPIPKTANIWVARHGQTVSNREGRFCGHSETELTDFGRQQAHALAFRLRNVKFAAAYTSDYRRAIETAAIVLADRGISPAVDPDLREIHYGEWELERESEIRKRSPAQHKLMREEDAAWQPPSGENMLQVRQRTLEALRRIGGRHAGEHVLIIGHGTAIACMIAAALDMAPSRTLRLEAGNCGLSLLTVTGARIGLALFNQTDFLPTGAGTTQ